MNVNPAGSRPLDDSLSMAEMEAKIEEQTINTAVANGMMSRRPDGTVFMNRQQRRRALRKKNRTKLHRKP